MGTFAAVGGGVAARVDCKGFFWDMVLVQGDAS
jgi:hypothetical protein